MQNTDTPRLQTAAHSEPNAGTDSPSFRREGDFFDVEEHSAALGRELKLGDLVLAQILIVVTYNFVGTAAKLGSEHLWYWLIGIALFYIPLAATVSYLNRRMPLEGGLYQWAKLGFNKGTGFFVAWNMWLYVIVYLSSIGVEISTYLRYALGDSAHWLVSGKPFVIALTCAIVGLLVWSAIMNLHLGKILYNIGSVASLTVFAILILLPLINQALGRSVEYRPLPLVAPTVSLFSLNILTKMAFGGLCAFEHVAIFAGECQSPARNIGRSVAVAAPIIALMYILGTSSVLAFTKPDEVDLIGPLPQALSVGMIPNLPFAAPALILMLAFSQAAYGGILLAAMARLPMVAGWDSLMPGWFAELHPKYKTPAHSVLFISALILTTGIVSILGASEQEAFQMLVNGSFIFYALTYIVMFAIPIAGKTGISDEKSSGWIRLAAVLGGGMSAAFIALSVFPIVEVANPVIFAVKISAVTVGANLLGGVLYASLRRRSAPQRRFESETASAGEF